MSERDHIIELEASIKRLENALRSERAAHQAEVRRHKQTLASIEETTTLKQAIQDGDANAAQSILNRAIQSRLARVKPAEHSLVSLTTIDNKLDRVLELLDPNYERSSK